jgi:hypothetical protein
VRDLKAAETSSDLLAGKLRKKHKHLQATRNPAECAGGVAHGEIRANLANAASETWIKMLWQPQGNGKRNKLMDPICIFGFVFLMACSKQPDAGLVGVLAPQ